MIRKIIINGRAGTVVFPDIVHLGSEAVPAERIAEVRDSTVGRFVETRFLAADGTLLGVDGGRFDAAARAAWAGQALDHPGDAVSDAFIEARIAIDTAIRDAFIEDRDHGVIVQLAERFGEEGLCALLHRLREIAEGGPETILGWAQDAAEEQFERACAAEADRSIPF